MLDLPIPDDDPAGVWANVPVLGAGGLGEIAVQVDVDHSSPADLVVELVSPNGTTVRLHNQTSGSPRAVFGVERDPDGPGALERFVGDPFQGTWTLVVRDLSPGDAGVLRAFAVFVTPGAQGE